MLRYKAGLAPIHASARASYPDPRHPPAMPACGWRGNRGAALPRCGRARLDPLEQGRANSSSGSIGLAMWSFMPAARQRSVSASMALAVMATIGRARNAGSFAHFHASPPRRPSPASACPSARCRRRPAGTLSTAICAVLGHVAPRSRRRSGVRTATSWLSSLSSTSRMRAPRKRGQAGFRRWTRFARSPVASSPASPSTRISVSNSSEGADRLDQHAPRSRPRSASLITSSRP